MRRNLSKPIMVMLIILGIIFGLIFAYKAFVAHMMGKYMKGGMPPSVVSTTKAQYELWQPHTKAAGSLRAVRGVDVTTEVQGIVQGIMFKPGADVQEGQVLIDLRNAADLAKLQSLQANAALAEVVYKRDKAQYEIQAVSKAALDADEANLKSAQAQVAEQTAIVNKKQIKAPFAGRLGVSLVNPGQFLNPGDKIVTLQQLAPIYVDFFLPQQQLVNLTVNELAVLKTDSYPNKTFTGRVTTINPQVDPATRNVQVEATITNAERLLYPGMYGTVVINTGKPVRYITLPVTAITFNPYGEVVFLVRDQGKDETGQPKLIAEQAFVTVGPTRGNQIAIISGIKEGDIVVTSGQLKIKNGSPVVINNKIQPNASPNVVVPEQ